MDDIGALKVADLKTELKSRGLSNTGSKAELQQRLIESLTLPSSACGQLPSVALPGVTASGLAEAALLPEIPTEEEEALLGSADEAALLDGAEDSALLDTTDLGLAKQPIVDGETKVPKMPIKLQKPKFVDPPKDPLALPGAPAVIQEETTAEKPTKIKLALEPTSADVLEKRRLKFGSSVSGEVQKNLRAARFGTASTASESTKPSKIVATEIADVDTLRKRASRFGNSTASVTLPAANLVSDEAKLKRADRFELKSNGQASAGAASSPGSTDELLQKRAARFGLKNAKESNKIGSEPPVSDEVMTKRAARFGTAVKVKTATNDSGASAPTIVAMKKRAARFNEENDEVKRAKRLEKFSIPTSA